MVAARLREYMVENGLKPGDRLPTEGELSQAYGVSRNSVREATKGLRFLGVIDAAPRRGLTVGNISMERISECVGFHFAMGDYPMGELIDTRIIVETGGLRQLADRMAADPSIYLELDALNDKLRRTKRMASWIKGDINFHRSLVASTGLSVLATFNDLIQVFFLKFREDFPRSQWKSGVKVHQQIIDSLRDGEPSIAAKHLSAHIGSHRERVTTDQ